MRSLVLALALLFVGGGAVAGPIADFDRDFDLAYAAYRQALFLTNAGDQPGSRKALESFASRWTALRARWEGKPPPHFSEDTKWRETLTGVGTLIASAATRVTDGSLPKAHEILEGVRDQVADARARNGLIRFSDHMNAYHEKMESLLVGVKAKLDTAAIRRLADDLAVLAYLVERIEHGAPRAYREDPAFVGALDALRASVRSARASVLSADAAKFRNAVRALKKPYAQMFIAFG